MNFAAHRGVGDVQIPFNQRIFSHNEIPLSEDLPFEMAVDPHGALKSQLPFEVGALPEKSDPFVPVFHR